MDKITKWFFRPLFEINWRPPNIYYHAGLFLRFGNKSYRIFKVGKSND